MAAGNAFQSCAEDTANHSTRCSRYRNAAICYFDGEDEIRAAWTYINAELYDDAAQLFRKHALFDDAVEVIRKYREEMNPELANRILDVVRLEYFRTGRLEYELHGFCTAWDNDS